MANDRLATLSARLRSAAGKPMREPVLIAAPPSPPSPPPETLLLTLAEAAAVCRVHPRTLAKWPLPFIRLGRILRVRRADLEAFLAGAREGGGDAK